jgi:acyl carrier protein
MEAAMQVDFDEAVARLDQIWREVLGVACVEPTQNFFELGGDSYAAMLLLVHVDEVFSVTLDMGDLLEFPVLEDFARRVVRSDRELSQAASTPP